MVSLDAVFECPECGVSEGQVHKHGCQSELCPFCGRVFAPEVFGCCEYEVTSKDLEKIGRRIPYIEYPIFCAKCGQMYPEFFLVSDEEWKHYIQPDKRDSVICQECYTEIKALIDKQE